MAHKNITPEMFKEIEFPQKDVSSLRTSKYRIYTDYDHFTLVEADNAQSAIAASGITHPVKVLRDSIYLQNVMMLDTIIAKPDSQQDNDPVAQPQAETAKEAIATEAASEQPVESAEGTQAEGALSSEEVDNLLKPSS